MEGIRKVFIREAKRTTVEPGGGAYKTENEWMLDTEGAAGCQSTSVLSCALVCVMFSHENAWSWPGCSKASTGGGNAQASVRQFPA